MDRAARAQTHGHCQRPHRGRRRRKRRYRKRQVEHHRSRSGSRDTNSNTQHRSKRTNHRSDHGEGHVLQNSDRILHDGSGHHRRRGNRIGETTRRELARGAHHAERRSGTPDRVPPGRRSTGLGRTWEHGIRDTGSGHSRTKTATDRAVQAGAGCARCGRRLLRGAPFQREHPRAELPHHGRPCI